MEDLEIHIQTVIHLQLVMDKPTPGRGNCFFEAVCQQLNNRPELDLPNVYTAGTLRKAICEYAITKSDPKIQELADEHDMQASVTFRTPWDVFFTNMKKNGSFAEGPVLYVAALLLKRDMAIISFGNNRVNPYMNVPGHGERRSYPPLYLGNQINLHFQSFLPFKPTVEVPKAIPHSTTPTLTATPKSTTAATPKSTTTKTATRTTTEFPTAPSSRSTAATPTSTTALKAPSATPKLSGGTQSPKSTPAAKRNLLEKITAPPMMLRNIKEMEDVEKVGNLATTNVTLLVKEVRRLHALVQSLQYQLDRCKEEVKKREEMDVIILDDLDDIDAATDEELMSTPI